MKSLVSIVGIFVAIIGASCQNIPVKTEYGTAFVEPDDLLESALRVALEPMGIYKVEVDRRHNHDNSAFKIELKTHGIIGVNLDDTLEKVLRNDLGLTSAKVNSRHDYSHTYNNEGKFYVLLDPNSSKGQLQALAQKTMKTTYLKLDNDPW